MDWDQNMVRVVGSALVVTGSVATSAATLTTSGSTVIAGSPSGNIAEVTANQELKVDVSGSTGGAVVSEAITATAFDLQAAAYNASSSITDDYILDNITFEFSSAESRTITLTAPDGTVLYEDTNTNTSVSLSDITNAFDAGTDFTIDVTQTAGACTMDVTAIVRTSSASLVGQPHIQAYDGTAWQDVRLDASTHALESVDYAHHEIHGGNHYFIGSYTTLGNGDVIEFATLTGSTTKWAHMLFNFAVTQSTTVEVYEDTGSPTGGGATIPFNNNRNNANTSQMIVIGNPTSINSGAGTLLESQLIGVRNVTADSGRDDELIMKQGTWYLWKFISKAASNNLTFKGMWYEHTDKS